jgi:hypothetical protein
MATFKVSQKRENKKGEAPIYISFYLNREKIEVPVRICVPLVFFDKEVKGLTIMPKRRPIQIQFYVHYQRSLLQKQRQST